MLDEAEGKLLYNSILLLVWMKSTTICLEDVQIIDDNHYRQIIVRFRDFFTTI